MKLPFEIEHLDSLGQGVSKITDKITFITKVLPNEKGNCQVYAKKSKVQFAQLEELSEKSLLRIQPDCVHYNDCPSCHYLHTEYKNELHFKEESLRHLISKVLKINEYPIQVHSAQDRFAYRNRMQLHYDKKESKLGQYSRFHDAIIEIPKCQLPLAPLQQAIKSLYENQSWKKLVEDQPSKGHIELYFHHQKLHTAINERYAFGGFTQVNEKMNEVAKDLFSNRFQKDFPSENLSKMKIIDLFGGKGNLSQDFAFETLVIDAGDYPQDIFKNHQTYMRCNLYEKGILNKLERLLKKYQFQTPELLILDPPRSGFKELSELLEKTGSQKVYYMSCQADTALRDIAKCQNYDLEEVHLVDFFPSTYHFETIFFLSKKPL